LNPLDVHAFRPLLQDELFKTYYEAYQLLFARSFPERGGSNSPVGGKGAAIQALFETTAEVLNKLINAYSRFEAELEEKARRMAA
jgi:hypothetical protein